MNLKCLSLILVVFLIVGSTFVESQGAYGLRRRWRFPWRRRWEEPWQRPWRCPYWDWRCREIYWG